MHTYQDLKAKFPGCYSVGADVIARVDNQNVVVAELANGSFNLTKKGQELMGAEPAGDVKEPKAPNPRKGSKAPKPEPEAPSVEEPESPSLDDILAE